MNLPPCMILAGGRATRMGGGDKGLLELAGRPILAHVIERLRAQCGALAINTNGAPERFSRFDLPVFADGIAGQPGPMAGVLAAMDWAVSLGAEVVLTTAADTPFLPGDLVSKLHGHLPALAASKDASGKLRTHPTTALWPVSLRGDLRAQLDQGQRRIGRFAREAGAQVVEFQGTPDPFFNINTPEDLTQARAWLTP